MENPENKRGRRGPAAGLRAWSEMETFLAQNLSSPFLLSLFWIILEDWKFWLIICAQRETLSCHFPVLEDYSCAAGAGSLSFPYHLLFLLKIAAHYAGITGEAEERFLSNNFCRMVVVAASRADFGGVEGRFK